MADRRAGPAEPLHLGWAAVAHAVVGLFLGGILFLPVTLAEAHVRTVHLGEVSGSYSDDHAFVGAWCLGLCAAVYVSAAPTVGHLLGRHHVVGWLALLAGLWGGARLALVVVGQHPGPSV